MNKRGTLSVFFGSIGSAINAARAVEGNKLPTAGDLKALGIDPTQFRKIMGR
ncbi:MAG: hypothetical protein M9924_06895 [Rhizobiaceae bacterium]|nr:hypothetical protein [Rhizobiaceae bacterium]